MVAVCCGINHEVYHHDAEEAYRTEFSEQVHPRLDHSQLLLTWGVVVEENVYVLLLLAHIDIFADCTDHSVAVSFLNDGICVQERVGVA